MSLLTRARAAEYITARLTGITITPVGLANMASDDDGPEYSILRGRAVYTSDACDRWIAAQLARPVVRRGRNQPAA